MTFADFKRRPWPCQLSDAVQASLFSSLLAEEGVPHQIVRHGNRLWGHSEQVIDGWGHVETIPEHQKTMEDLYNEFLASEDPLPEEVGMDDN